MLTFFMANKSQLFLGAVCRFPHPRIFIRDGDAHLVRVTRFTMLPIAEF